MLGILKYQKDKGKDGERKDAAATALSLYNSLSAPNERANFVQEFEAQGGGKTAAGLKFALTFKKELESKKKVGFESEENMLTRRAVCII